MGKRRVRLFVLKILNQEGGSFMKRIWKFLSLILVFVLVLTPVAPASAAAISTKDTDLTGYTVILHTNDTHGRAIPDSSGGNMGYAAVSALKKSAEAAGAQVILLDAGDTLHGLPFATVSRGESIVELMNLVGYDAMTPGNHDFNYGSARLSELSKLMKFPLLSSNVVVKANGQNFLQNHIIITKNGVDYGIFGLSTPQTEYMTNPKNVDTLEFRNPVEAAKLEVANLKASGADVIIALAHIGTDKSSDFTSERIAKEVDGIDLIVDGHSHSLHEEGLKVEDTLIVSTGDYLKNIGVAVFDKEGKLSAGTINAKTFTETDPYVSQVIEKVSKANDTALSEVIGKTSVVLDGVRENVRTKETNLGDLTADAMRHGTNADVAITNGGGIRTSIEVGDITKLDMVTVFPFGNYVVTKYVTGEALVQALELGVSGYPAVSGPFPQVSGITFGIDASKPAGSRVTDVKVNGKPVDLKAKYLLATNDFMAVGGDGYTMLKDFALENEFGALEEILMAYIKELGVVNIQADGRIKVVAEATVKEPEETKEPEVKKEEPAKEVKEEKKEEVKKEKKEEVKEPKKEKENGKADKVKIYVVQKGDYLRKIANVLLGNEGEWKKIYEWNKDIIKNPNQIQIGQKLKILPN